MLKTTSLPPALTYRAEPNTTDNADIKAQRLQLTPRDKSKVQINSQTRLIPAVVH